MVERPVPPLPAKETQREVRGTWIGKQERPRGWPLSCWRAGVALTGGTGPASAAGPAGAAPGLVSWGANGDGQLGTGDSRTGTLPRPVTGTHPAFVQAATGSDHSLAVADDGTVWAWGENADGQLGDGTEQPRPTPVRVVGLTGVKQVAAGVDYSLALRKDGTVWAWGDNRNGRLGDGTTEDRRLPVPVAGLTAVTRIAAGEAHSLALRGGELWAWGRNDFGQVGDGTFSDAPRPVRVRRLPLGVTDVAGGTDFSIASSADGSVWTWGGNYAGQLGNGGTGTRPVPGLIAGLAGITQVAAGNAHAFALDDQGFLWAWGHNGGGELGVGDYLVHRRPTWVLTSETLAIVASAGGGYATRSDGAVLTWGSDSRTYADGATTGRNRPSTAPALTLATVMSSASARHGLALGVPKLYPYVYVDITPRSVTTPVGHSGYAVAQIVPANGATGEVTLVVSDSLPSGTVVIEPTAWFGTFRITVTPTAPTDHDAVRIRGSGPGMPLVYASLEVTTT